MKCPHDGAEMAHVTRHGVEIDYCPACGGVWLDRGELDHLIEAVRPAIALDNPEPPRPPAPPPLAGEPEEARGRRRAPEPDRETYARRDDDRRRESLNEGRRRDRPDDWYDRDDDHDRGHRYGSKYSRKSRFKNILEDIFDFD